MILTKTKEYILEQDREALLVSPGMHGNMGVYINPDGSVQYLSKKTIDVD